MFFLVCINNYVLFLPHDNKKQFIPRKINYRCIVSHAPFKKIIFRRINSASTKTILVLVLNVENIFCWPHIEVEFSRFAFMRMHKTTLQSFLDIFHSVLIADDDNRDYWNAQNRGTTPPSPFFVFLTLRHCITLIISNLYKKNQFLCSFLLLICPFILKNQFLCLAKSSISSKIWFYFWTSIFNSNTRKKS